MINWHIRNQGWKRLVKLANSQNVNLYLRSFKASRILDMGCFFFIYQYFWLRSGLRKGFSASRTMGNSAAKSSVYSSKSLLIICSCDMISGRLILIFGMLGSLFFTYSFFQMDNLPYPKTQSQEYWEALLVVPTIFV